jgi:hypothetical protein
MSMGEEIGLAVFKAENGYWKWHCKETRGYTNAKSALEYRSQLAGELNERQ